MIPVKVSYGNSKRRPGALERLADVLLFLAQCQEVPKAFVLKYRDDENELMTVTSEKEFGEALQLCAKQKVLQLEVVEAAESDPVALRKGEKLPDTDEEPFQIVTPDHPAEKQPGEAVEEKVEPADSKDAKPVAGNAFVAAMDKTASVKPQSQPQAQHTPLEMLDSLLAQLCNKKDAVVMFKSTRTAFQQELAALAAGTPAAPAPAQQQQQQQQPAPVLKPADEKPAVQPAVPVSVPVVVAAQPESKPAPEEKKRGSKDKGRDHKATPPPLTRPPSKFQAQLEELQNMGFGNEAKNESLLERYKGNVQKCVNVLITEGN